MTDEGSPERVAPRKNPQQAVQPQRARGVKIVLGVAAGLLVALALAVWGFTHGFGG